MFCLFKFRENHFYTAVSIKPSSWKSKVGQNGLTVVERLFLSKQFVGFLCVCTQNHVSLNFTSLYRVFFFKQYYIFMALMVIVAIILYSEESNLWVSAASGSHKYQGRCNWQ